jgi:hypothetical protein
MTDAEVDFCLAVRTPLGRFGGSLRSMRSSDLGVAGARSARPDRDHPS